MPETVNEQKGDTVMDEKKSKETQGVQKLTDKEIKAVNGGIKIVLGDRPKWINTILRFFFKSK